MLDSLRYDVSMEVTRAASEFDSKPPVPQPVLEGPLAALLEWQAMAEGAYSTNTLRAQKADGAIFQAFCESRCDPYLPADPKTIRAFIEDRVKAGKKPATIRRYAATISRVHTAAGLFPPLAEARFFLAQVWGFSLLTAVARDWEKYLRPLFRWNRE